MADEVTVHSENDGTLYCNQVVGGPDLSLVSRIRFLDRLRVSRPSFGASMYRERERRCYAHAYPVAPFTVCLES